MKSFVLTVVFSMVSMAAFSQASTWPVSKWVKRVGDGSDKTTTFAQQYNSVIAVPDTSRQRLCRAS